MTAQNNWNAIKRHYAELSDRIKATPRNEWACDPYSWDAGKNMIFMTPIELNFWSDCRQADLILYPQYPACGYFLDFANPVSKVGIECDGRAFHMDKDREAKREGVLVRNGWKIYRIEGWQCNQEWDEETCRPPFGREMADFIGAFHGIKRREKQSSNPRHVGEFVDAMLARLARYAV